MLIEEMSKLKLLMKMNPDFQEGIQLLVFINKKVA